MTTMAAILLLLAASSCHAFVLNAPSRHAARRSSTSQLRAVDYETVSEVGYQTSVSKPMGVIFGENPDPFYGLVVDDISEGLNGARAGLRVGDQLLAVNGQVVVGDSFDSVMSSLQAAPGSLDLVMFRGSVASLYTILENKSGGMADDDDDEEEEAWNPDEDYESPVVIEVKESKPLTPGDFVKAFKKVGSMLMEDDAPKSPEGEKKEKKKGGFFGFGAEAIQLDGDDANTLK